MFDRFFGFTETPFQRHVPPEKLLRTERLKAAIRRLSFVVQKRGVGVLTGPPGCGKTTVIRALCSELADQRLRFHYVLACRQEAGGLLRRIAWDLGIEAFRGFDLERKLKEELRARLSKHLTTVIVVDEAQNLSSECLWELAHLVSRDMDSENSAALILVGQKALLERLSLAVNEPFAQRVLLYHSLPPAPREEVLEYLAWQLTRVGGKPSIFKPNSKELIYTASGGALRVVDQIATEALCLAAERNLRSVDNELVAQAIDNLRALKQRES